MDRWAGGLVDAWMDGQTDRRLPEIANYYKSRGERAVERPERR
jgi:hypothetical protein